MLRLRLARCVIVAVTCWSCCSGSAQVPGSAGAPPKVLLMVHQQMLPGKAGEREKFELETCRKFDELGIPVYWIETEAVTGTPGALFLDPASSFEEMDRAGQVLGEAFGAHPELAQLQQEIEQRLANSKTVFAVRRDDLGSGVNRIDWSKARYLQINVVSVRPGHEGDFAEADRIRSRVQADATWTVYEMDSGTSVPTFLVIEALGSLTDRDKESKAKAAGEKESKELEQLVRDAYASVESNMYGLHPEMSHVSNKFAAGDPEFWRRK
jgi:hypothetical protein